MSKGFHENKVLFFKISGEIETEIIFRKITSFKENNIMS